MNMLQVHNPESYVSNELIFYVESREEAIQRYRKEPAYLLTTILNSAIINDNPEEARIVIDAGADLNMPHEHFEKERPPILIASQYGQGWLVDELLRKGADVNIKDKHGNTALHEAAKMGHLEICRKLIEAGARKGVVNDWNKRPSDQTSFFMSKKNFDRYHARNHSNLKLDHQRYLRDRVKVLALLRP
jgi:ankyrin repeat protein